MKYTKEITDKLLAYYEEGMEAEKIAEVLAEEFNCEVPIKSVIAKLSSLKVYKKKGYLTKRGEVPVKKEEYIEKIAEALGVNVDLLESMEKVNKHVLILLNTALEQVLHK